MSENLLQGKTAILTGGGSGIGEAISKCFVDNGAYVHVLDIDQKAIQDASTEITEKERQYTYHRCDVSNHSEVKTIIGGIASKGPIDILVNNAGVAHVGNIENTSEADLNKLYDINVKGVYNCIHSCIGPMKENGGGVILNMASIAASVGIPDRFAYSMTKGAVLTMTYSVAIDYINDNIRCNCISPARVHTPFVDGFLEKNYPGKEEEMFGKLSQSQPIGRMGKPWEIAELATFLCSDKAAFTTGTDYPIDGGFIKLKR